MEISKHAHKNFLDLQFGPMLMLETLFSILSLDRGGRLNLSSSAPSRVFVIRHCLRRRIESLPLF